MAKKKSNPTVVNNIESVNMELDYDKLAEAIVKAQQKAQEVNSPSRELMKYILVPAFICVAVFSGLLSIVMFVTLIKNVTAVFDSGVLNGIIIVLLEFFISFFLAGLCVFAIVTVKEIDEENDRNYVASMFSNITSIAALIVALIAIIKGVG